MKITLLFVFCTLSISASAQFWKKKKAPEVTLPTPLPQAAADFSVIVSDAKNNMPDVVPVSLKRSVWSIELEEDVVLKAAKRNMRYREYGTASYNFSKLAELYILQNRFSEAKWYLLQSNAISREQNDDKHTVSNLLDLAGIKLAIGEPNLAKVDLLEAHDLALAKGLTTDAETIEQQLRALQANKKPIIKAEQHYAHAVELAAKPL